MGVCGRSVAVTVCQVGWSIGGTGEFRVVVSDKIEVPEVELALIEDGDVKTTIVLAFGETLPPKINTVPPKASLKVGSMVLCVMLLSVSLLPLSARALVCVCVRVRVCV